MMISRFVVATVAVLLILGCSGQPEVEQAPADEAPVVADTGWTTVAAEELTEAQKEQQQRGVDAVQAMAGQLMGELTTALDGGGADGAIQVCSMRAPEVAAMVSNEYGVVLGRTSHRLRNQANRPPEWAEELVRDQVAGPTWLVGPDGRLAGMMPIKLKAECGMCHGPQEEISAEVMAKIAEFYPDDEATGFVEGDLRGWVWFEAPQS